MSPFAATRVFVYGTLKRGGSNHSFLAGQEFLGTARTAPGFTLYSLGDYPGMVRDSGDGTGVEGELWAVDATCLTRLDELEGVAEGLYERVPVPLAAPPRTSAESYLYRRPIQHLPRVGSTWPESDSCN